MSELHDYLVPEPHRRADARSARRLERLSSRAQEVDRALAAVSEGKGGLVWTAEHGMGASATLELVCEAVASHTFAHPTLTLRCRPPAGAPAPGSAVVSLVSQVSQLAGGVVPERLLIGHRSLQPAARRLVLQCLIEAGLRGGLDERFQRQGQLLTVAWVDLDRVLLGLVAGAFGAHGV